MTDAPETLTVVVASDSFKGSLTAGEATGAMARGVSAALGAGAAIIEAPLADGGEGTLDVLLQAWGGSVRAVDTFDAIGRPIRARYGLNADRSIALIEAAEANGLPAVSDQPLQPLRADSYGVGLIARDAIEQGVSEILLCVGGSASTDGGSGLMRGLGARFLDADGDEVPPGGGGLDAVRAVDLDGLVPGADAVRWKIAVDVTNPLLGPLGAAAVFGPQKGASEDDVRALERGLEAYVASVCASGACEATTVAATPGLGAAGGIAFAPMVYLGARLVPGAELVAGAMDLAAVIARADIVFTGEGSLDSQSLDGKVVDLVRRTAAPSTPVIVIAGRVGLSAEECAREGITAAFSIAPGPSELAELAANAATLIEDRAAQVAALIAPTRRRAPGSR